MLTWEVLYPHQALSLNQQPDIRFLWLLSSSALIFITIINIIAKINLAEERIYLASTVLSEPERSQCRNSSKHLQAGTEAETAEELCLLVRFS